MKGKTLQKIINTPKAGLKELSSLPDNEEFNVEIISKDSGKVYTVSTDALGSGEGGGGSSAFFSNQVDVETNITLDTSHLNKIIKILEEVVVTMPPASTCSVGDRICFVVKEHENAYIINPDTNEDIYLHPQEHFIMIVSLNSSGDKKWYPFSSSIEYNNVEDKSKSALRDLYDQSQNANSYSTDEIKTGGTWIDGKPIYRKTFTSIINSVNQTIPFDNTGIIIRKIETLFGDINNNGVGTFNSLFAFTDSVNYTDIKAYYFQDDLNFIIINRKANEGVITPAFTNAEIYITIEYTKTTD
mgnify:CR=1 FL=1